MDDIRCDGPGAEALAKQLTADERLSAGTDGYWQHWGARPSDIRPGDIVVTLDSGAMVLDEIATSEDWHGLRQSLVTVSGKEFSLGHLFRGFQVFRYGTHNTLA